MSDSTASVSTWIERLKTGDQEAAARLWELYFKRLLALARARLMPLRRQGAADEEDVVLSAFHDFYRAARAERYAHLHGRGDLWRLLATFVANKAKTLIDRESADKRGGGRLRGDSAFGLPGSDSSGPQGFARAPASEPDPALAVELEEKFQRFFTGLTDQETEIACLRLEGHGTQEIAERLRLAPATIRRRMQIIRGVLAREFGDCRDP